MTLKNNIEAIIIKWAYQIDEVLSRDSDEELNIPGTYLFHSLLLKTLFQVLYKIFLGYTLKVYDFILLTL